MNSGLLKCVCQCMSEWVNVGAMRFMSGAKRTNGREHDHDHNRLSAHLIQPETLPNKSLLDNSINGATKLCHAVNQMCYSHSIMICCLFYFIFLFLTLSCFFAWLAAWLPAFFVAVFLFVIFVYKNFQFYLSSFVLYVHFVSFSVVTLNRPFADY